MRIELALATLLLPVVPLAQERVTVKGVIS